MPVLPINDTSGKKLKIIDGDGNLVISQNLYIDGDVNLKTSSNFTSLWKASSNSLMNLVSSSFSFNGSALPSGQFPMQGVQVWESTEPLNYSLKASLYMQDDALTDVVYPSLTLMSLPLPTKSKAPYTDKLSETFNIKITTLIPSGPNIQGILESIGYKGNTNFGGLKSEKSRGVFTVKIADYMTITNVIIKGVDCDFSSTLDEKGYPVSSELNFEFTTMEIATTDMIENMKQYMK